MEVGQILRKEKLFLMKITLLRDTAWQKFNIFFVWHWKKKNVLSLQYTATQKCSLKAVCHNLTKWYNFDCLLFCHAQTNRLTRHHYLDKMRPVTRKATQMTSDPKFILMLFSSFRNKTSQFIDIQIKQPFHSVSISAPEHFWIFIMTHNTEENVFHVQLLLIHLCFYICSRARGRFLFLCN